MQVPAFPQVSWDTYTAISLVIATPWLYSTYKPFSTTPSTKTRSAQTASSLLLLHTLYMLHGLFVSSQENIFKSLGVPLNVPSDHLRSKLAESWVGEQNFPEHLQLLLRRLGLVEMRSLYVRFGHHALTTCSYCHSFGDFALYAFPGPLLEYIREIALIGFLTVPTSPLAAYRSFGLGALLISLMTEAYWALTVQVSIPSGIIADNLVVPMWHDTFVQLRHTLFLTLPLLIVFMPSMGLHRIPILGAFFPAPPRLDARSANLPPAQFKLPGQGPMLPEDATLGQTSALAMETLGHLVPTLHLLKYTHAAVMRSQGETSKGKDGESMAAKANEWWAEEAREGQIVRNDEEVHKVLKASGLGLDKEVKNGEEVVQAEGQLLTSAKMAVSFLKEQGAKPSQHWQ